VIPFATLLGEPAAPDTLLPSVSQVVLALTGTGQPPAVPGTPHPRYTVLPGGGWEYRYPVRLLPGAPGLAVDGFRRQWNARLVSEQEGRFLLHLDLQPPRHFWERWTSRPARLEMLVELSPRPGPSSRQSEVRVCLRPVRGNPAEVGRLLAEVGPHLFASIRSYLQAGPDHRDWDRRPCPLPVRVYPVRPDLEVGEVLEGVGRNISCGGVSFRVPQPPPAEKLYLHWHRSSPASAFALLAHVVRVHAAGPDAYDVGAAFPGPGPGAEELWDE
jgi:hypothetical protein